MQALFEMTVGEERLKKIIAERPADSEFWNEAQNRFQFIDRLLIECLGWEKPWIEVESTDEAEGRADYILGKPCRAVLEAKREARVFDALPQGQPSTVRKIAPLVKACSNFRAAVTQVIPYCTMHGAQIAIVCNGPQLAIFQSYLVGQSPLEGECYLFNGFDSYVQNFPLLWTLLSPEGIGENRAYQELALHRNPRIPEKVSASIAEPRKYKYRTSFQENLRDLSAVLLEEVEDNPELKRDFYQECYIPIEANNRHLLLSKQIIASRYKRVGGDGIVPASAKILARKSDSGVTLNEDEFSQTMSSRPIVVIGDVGVGKTSFFENLFQNLAAEDQDNTYFLHINLGMKASLSKDVRTHVLTEIPRILKDDYLIDIDDSDFVNSIYHKELQSFERSPQGRLKDIDKNEYLKAQINFLTEKLSRRDTHILAALAHLVYGRKKHIILVMDNADQREFAVQQEAFLIAQELATSRCAMVFVALRPSTFYESKSSGALSGYQNKILTISPPPADQVIERRLKFAMRVARGQVSPTALAGIRMRLTSTVHFFQATLRSIKSNPEIQLFLSNISGGNTRAVIELITAFFGSPNVDSEKIVTVEEERGNYIVPLHEFTKHALLGDYAYYNPQSSQVACNIFDLSAADPREHFLASLIISYLTSNIGVKDNDGFICGNNILAEMAKYLFLPEQVQFALRRLATKRLIETPHAHYREVKVSENEPPEQFHFRATSIGVYHVQYWTGSFAYLDATSIDTPIFDADLRGKVTQLAASFEIEDRWKKASFFKEYLDGQWHTANIGAQYYDFSSLIKGQAATFNSVKTFLDRRSEKNRFGFSRRG